MWPKEHVTFLRSRLCVAPVVLLPSSGQELTLVADKAFFCSVHSLVAKQVIFGTDASLVPTNSWIDLGRDHLSVRVVLNGETLLDAEPVDIPYGELLTLAPSLMISPAPPPESGLCWRLSSQSSH